MAAINGQFDAAMLLIEKGADPNLASKGNSVPPLWATINAQWQPRTRFPQPQQMELQKASYLQVMEALLKAGADPNGRIQSHPWYMVYTGCGNRNCGLADNSGSTPFWRAAYSVDLDAMKLLVKHGADRQHSDDGAAAGGSSRRWRPSGRQRRTGWRSGRRPVSPVRRRQTALAGRRAGLVARDVGAGGAVAPTPDANQARFSAAADSVRWPWRVPDSRRRWRRVRRRLRRQRPSSCARAAGCR